MCWYWSRNISLHRSDWRVRRRVAATRPLEGVAWTQKYFFRFGHKNIFFYICFHLELFLPPERSMSLMRVSMGVLPTSLTKNNCSITEAETVRSEGSLSRSFPNLVGWLGYWVLQYSSRAHCDFSCSCSTTEESVRPIASARTFQITLGLKSYRVTFKLNFFDVEL